MSRQTIFNVVSGRWHHNSIRCTNFLRTCPLGPGSPNWGINSLSIVRTSLGRTTLSQNSSVYWLYCGTCSHCFSRYRHLAQRTSAAIGSLLTTAHLFNSTISCDGRKWCSHILYWPMFKHTNHTSCTSINSHMEATCTVGSLSIFGSKGQPSKNITRRPIQY